MSNLKHIPAILNREEVIGVLQEILHGFTCEDTFEGSIEFLLNDDKTWAVTASYRVGNKMGQGGIKLIGSLEPD